MDIEIEKSLAALRDRHLNGFYSGTLEEARLQILSLIPKGAVVGAGDSATVRQIGILKIIEEKGGRSWILTRRKEQGSIPKTHTHTTSGSRGKQPSPMFLLPGRMHSLKTEGLSMWMPLETGCLEWFGGIPSR